MSKRTIVHFAALQTADEQIHMGPAFCRAADAARTVAGDWAYVTCLTCRRMLAATIKRENAEARARSMTDRAALDALADLLSRVEWGADLCEPVMRLIEATGRKVAYL